MKLFCEQSSLIWFQQPLNALTVLLYFASAYLAYRTLKTEENLTTSAKILIAAVCLIPPVTFIHHALMLPLTQSLAGGMIGLFIFLFVFYNLRQAMGWGQTKALITSFGFIVLTLLLVEYQENTTDLNNRPLWLNLKYGPSLLFLIFLSGRYWGEKVGRTFLFGTISFAAGLTMRTFDLPLCPQIPTGTYWLWHVAVAIMFYYLIIGTAWAEEKTKSA